MHVVPRAIEAKLNSKFKQLDLEKLHGEEAWEERSGSYTELETNRSKEKQDALARMNNDLQRKPRFIHKIILEESVPRTESSVKVNLVMKKPRDR